MIPLFKAVAVQIVVPEMEWVLAGTEDALAAETAKTDTSHVAGGDNYCIRPA